MTLTTGPSAKRTGGFTLLELVLVMLVMSIAVAVAAPSLRNFMHGRKSADAAANVIALGQYARTQSVSTGAVYRLNVDPAHGEYWLTAQRGANFEELGNEFGRHFSFPQGTNAQWISSPAGQREYIDFHPDGRVEAGTLELSDAYGTYAVGCLSETEPLTVLLR
ncbi:MAG TPA: GspH/FimT family pseudopilin, partial [Planctomycetota bacterium]|nr:GspH/FimT family pseudopilin [Planctomycetota bacterium]